MASVLRYKFCYFILISFTLFFMLAFYVDWKATVGDEKGHTGERTENFAENIQKERKKRILRYCKMKGNQKVNESRLVLYSPNARLLYCTVPKAATTTWKRLFQMFDKNLTTEEVLKFGKPETHKQQYNIYNLLPRARKEEIKKSYYSFLITRHPFERLVSAYRNKFADPYKSLYQRTYGVKILRMSRKKMTRNNGEGVTFGEFVNYIIKTRDFNKHWERIVILCPPCELNYNFIAKMDTLIEDSDMILRRAGLNRKYTFLSNATDRYETNSKDLTVKLFKRLTRGQIEKLYELYKEDFLAFGYDRNKYT